MFNIREVPWKIIVIYLLVSLGMCILVNLVLFPRSFFDPVAKATSNLISATLQANLLLMLIFGLIVFAWGKLRPSDVGLEWRKLVPGLAMVALVWLVVQGIFLLIDGLRGDIHLDPAWSQFGVTALVGELIGQLLGNAFFEEMTYRGFYLGQVYLKTKDESERWRQDWAVICTAGLFAVFHIPNRIFQGASFAQILTQMFLLFIMGLLFAWIYILSGNLFYTIGIHALINQPTLITEPSALAILLILGLGFLLPILLQAWKRQPASTPSPAS